MSFYCAMTGTPTMHLGLVPVGGFKYRSSADKSALLFFYLGGGGYARDIQKIPGQGLYLCHNSDLSHSSDISGSL